MNFSHLLSDPQYYYASFTGLDLDPMDCMSLGYFFANKQLDKPCTVGLNGCSVGDIGIEVLMKELSQGCILSKKVIGIELVLSDSECSLYGVKCISETISQAPVVWGLQFLGWILYKVDAAICLKYLVEGLCRRSVGIQSLTLQTCVSYKHTYHLVLLIVFGNLQVLDLSDNDIGRSSVMSLLAQSLKHSRTLEGLHMNECNINDDGLQHLGVYFETIKQ